MPPWTSALTGNQRVGPKEHAFSEWLLKLGNDELPKKKTNPFEGCIEIPQQCSSPQDIVLEVFPDDLPTEEYHCRAILTPHKDVSLIMNETILRKLDQPEMTYNRFDQIVSDEPEAAAIYTPEFINSLTPSGMPKHFLRLKVGSIIMLLRNINRAQGLSNGTRLQVINRPFSG